jgi:hypothetical protein
MTAKLLSPSSLVFFWKAEGDVSCRPLLFVFVLLQQKQKEGDDSFAAVTFFFLFFGREKGTTAGIPFFLFCFVTTRKRKR